MEKIYRSTGFGLKGSGLETGVYRQAKNTGFYGWFLMDIPLNFLFLFIKSL
jgi:hypothetical protein